MDESVGPRHERGVWWWWRPRNSGDTLSSSASPHHRCQRFHNHPHTTPATKVSHWKMATSSFELHYSYTVRLVNMRVSWIMNMPTCDARGYTIYVPGSDHGAHHCARLAAQHCLLGHSLLDLIWNSICPALYWILAKRATPGLRSTPSFKAVGSIVVTVLCVICWLLIYALTQCHFKCSIAYSCKVCILLFVL